MDQLKLIIVSGLPGSGKSTLAESIARELKIPVFSVDPIESSVIKSGFKKNFETGLAAYLVAETLASEQSISPHDQSIVGETVLTTTAELQEMYQQARSAVTTWRALSLVERAGYIARLAELYREHREELARLTSLEMGKPLSQARDDVDGEIDFIDWYTTDVIKALEGEALTTLGNTNFSVRYEPYGVVACIAPWNFPLSMVNSGTLPALLAGNTVLFKPSEYTTMIQKLAIELIQKNRCSRWCGAMCGWR